MVDGGTIFDGMACQRDMVYGMCGYWLRSNEGKGGVQANAVRYPDFLRVLLLLPMDEDGGRGEAAVAVCYCCY